MEEHRLQPMPSNYDPVVFNKLFSKTEGLRHKLASEINHHRFGLSHEDIVSFFNTKFIFVFAKYYNEPEEKLLAHILNALKNFKCRILRNAYTIKHSQSIVEADSVVYLSNTAMDNIDRDYYFNRLMDFMRQHLSENAFIILQVQLNPPPYILQRINPGKEANLQKIPDQLILEYFDLGNGYKANKYLTDIKKEIRHGINYAKSYFRSS